MTDVRVELVEQQLKRSADVAHLSVVKPGMQVTSKVDVLRRHPVQSAAEEVEDMWDNLPV